MTNEKIDNALFDALNMPAKTEGHKLHRAVTVYNLKHWYATNGIFWPALDSAQREVFDECTALSINIEIERCHHA